MDNETSGNQITIQIAAICDKTQLDNARLEQLVNSVCARFGLKRAIISIAIVDDEHITKLNSKFLKHGKTTDCLSFDLSDSPDADEKCFEIIVNAELASRCAEETDHSAQTELALYITHGLLHQFGFDDQSTEQAQKMHRAEEEILQRLGYDFVYN